VETTQKNEVTRSSCLKAEREEGTWTNRKYRRYGTKMNKEATMEVHRKLKILSTRQANRNIKS
jgi:hypothetical protein